MIRVTDYKLMDSSAWLALLYEEDKRVHKIVEDRQIIFTSVLSIFEIKKKLIEWNVISQKINNSINFIKARSILVEVDEKISESAVEAWKNNKLAAMDALIYATASSVNAELITLDDDFKGLPNVEVF